MIDENRISSQISKERQKETDEIFTSSECSDYMLSFFNPEDFKPGKTFLEPAAGDGNLVEKILIEKLKYCTPTEAITDIYAIEYMKDNYDFLCKRIINIIGDTPKHREIINHNFAYANTLDQNDTSDGRKYPTWMPDYKQAPSLDFLFDF